MSEYIEVSRIGLRCYADSYIISDDNFLFYISIFGRPALIKAMTATILAGKNIYVSGQMVTKAGNGTETFTQNLGEGLVHKGVIQKSGKI